MLGPELVLKATLTRSSASSSVRDKGEPKDGSSRNTLHKTYADLT